jgi:hypothetical protein
VHLTREYRHRTFCGFIGTFKSAARDSVQNLVHILLFILKGLIGIGTAKSTWIYSLFGILLLNRGCRSGPACIRIIFESWILIWIRIVVKSYIRIRIKKVRTSEFYWLQIDPWRFCRPAVVDLHHFDKEQDPDPLQSEKMDLDPH